VGLTFYIVDVFAEEKYAGTQLAVVRGGADLPDERLQKIALEMNYSETTFVLSEQEVATGLPALVVPLRDPDALRRCKVDWERCTGVASPGKNLNVFCPEPHEDGPGDLSALMFANDLGVPEDPATGSAAGCLAAYLLEHSYLGTDSVDVRVEQGYEIGRPSLLYLQAARVGDQTTVHVGGKVQMVARGELV
jgi:trans-2,3-dihydro-3-hydroxyanthranilate isomerase